MNNQRQTSFLTERPAFVSILIGCLILGAWLSNNSVGVAAQAPKSNDYSDNMRHVATPSVVQFDSVADAAAYEKDKQIQAELMTKREEARLKRDQAGEKMKESREYYQYFWQAQWTNVVWPKLEEFNALRSEAAHSDTGSVPCTLCNGRGQMASCVLCANSGKCPGCNGTGKHSHDQLCPTCLGTGHCFLCGGSGKMTCPFCDDGQVGAHQHDPSNHFPIN